MLHFLRHPIPHSLSLPRTKVVDPVGNGEDFLGPGFPDAGWIQGVIRSQVQMMSAADDRHRNNGGVVGYGIQNTGAAPRIEISVGKDDVGGGENVASPESHGILKRR